MRRLAMLAGVLGGAIPVMAQTTAPPFSDTVVVTASLAEEEEGELPSTTEVLTEEEIRERQVAEVVDLLRTVPGLSVARAGSPGHLASVFSRGTNSTHTLILWNGVPLNDPFFGGFDWAHLPTEGVERVEVVRGPFSALYGSAAIGGAVQVLTGRRQGGELRLEAGELGHRRAALAAGWGDDRFHLDVTGHLRQADGELENDDYDSEELFARGEWSFGEANRVGVLARLNDAEVEIPLSSGLPSPSRHQTQETRLLAMPVHAEGRHWTLDALVSRAETALAFRDPDDPFLPASDTDAERLRGRVAGSYRFGEDLWVAGGTEWERQQVDRSTAFGTDLAGERRESWALFAQVYKSWRRLRVEAGVRHHQDELFGGQVVPRAGLVLLPGGGWRLHASYGEGFRSPSIGELFFPFFGNPGLEPEESESWELGAGWEGESWSFRATGFDNRLTNLITSDPATFQAVNLGRARSRGVEGEVRWRRGILDLALNGTLLEAEDEETGEPLLRRPEESANLVLTVSPGDFRANLVASYVGDRPDFDPATFVRTSNPSFLVLEVAGEWVATGRLAPLFRILNVLDREYAEVLGFPAPGRSLLAGVGVRF